MKELSSLAELTCSAQDPTTNNQISYSSCVEHTTCTVRFLVRKCWLKVKSYFMFTLSNQSCYISLTCVGGYSNYSRCHIKLCISLFRYDHFNDHNSQLFFDDVKIVLTELAGGVIVITEFARGATGIGLSRWRSSWLSVVSSSF